MNDTKDREVAAVLYLASELMDQHGKITGQFWEGPSWNGGPMCTEGAVRIACSLIYDQPQLTSGGPAFHRSMVALEGELPLMTNAAGIQLRCVPSWNDRVCAGKDEAVALLRRTAEKYDDIVAPVELPVLAPEPCGVA